MDQQDTQGRALSPIELARLELDAIEEGLVRLRTLLREAAETAPPPAQPRFRRADDLDAASHARAIAAQMALSGSTRAEAAGRLTGVVPVAELSDILDDAYVAGD